MSEGPTFHDMDNVRVLYQNSDLAVFLEPINEAVTRLTLLTNRGECWPMDTTAVFRSEEETAHGVSVDLLAFDPVDQDWRLDATQVVASGRVEP